jgi:hypothetical protein
LEVFGGLFGHPVFQASILVLDFAEEGGREIDDLIYDRFFFLGMGHLAVEYADANQGDQE